MTTPTTPHCCVQAALETSIGVSSLCLFRSCLSSQLLQQFAKTLHPLFPSPGSCSSYSTRDKCADTEKTASPWRCWLHCLMWEMQPISSECKLGGLPKTSFQKKFFRYGVWCPQTRLQLAMPDGGKILACTFFFFYLQRPKSSKQDYLGSGGPTWLARHSPTI